MEVWDSPHPSPCGIHFSSFDFCLSFSLTGNLRPSCLTACELQQSRCWGSLPTSTKVAQAPTPTTMSTLIPTTGRSEVEAATMMTGTRGAATGAGCSRSARAAATPSSPGMRADLPDAARRQTEETLMAPKALPRPRLLSYPGRVATARTGQPHPTHQ